MNKLAKHAEVVSLSEGEVLAKEGEMTDYIFVVVDGELNVEKRVSKIAEDTVHLLTLKSGEYAGATTLLEGSPLSASLIASASPTRVLRLSNAAFKELLDTNPLISGSILRELSKELRSFRTVLARNLAASTSGSESKTPSKGASFRMAVFDFMTHEKGAFKSAAEKLNKEMKDKAFIDVVYLNSKLNEKTVGLAAGCQAVSVFVNDNVDAEVLTLLHAQGVELVALRCAGTDNVDMKAAEALGITVARVPAYSPYAVAEFAASIAMALNRRIVCASNRVKQGNFSLTNLVGFDMHGKTVGVIGTGKIGRCFIKIMLGFGCKILCHDARPSDEVSKWEGCSYVPLDEVLSRSRVVSLHCPLLPDTRHLINADTLSKMQRGAILINTSRGGLVDTSALIESLKAGHLGGAGLDVYENEGELFFADRSGDLGIEDDVFARLASFNNVIVTGHQAFLTEEALEKIAAVTFENVAQYCVEGKRGEELSNVVKA
ncbi:hypothetical protein HK101_001232 [Irineochytrium annulatum]|nr:hypothetical protein HK101_001232 [Irineochytrium annulatum]